MKKSGEGLLYVAACGAAVFDIMYHCYNILAQFGAESKAVDLVLQFGLQAGFYNNFWNLKLAIFVSLAMTVIGRAVTDDNTPWNRLIWYGTAGTILLLLTKITSSYLYILCLIGSFILLAYFFAKLASKVHQFGGDLEEANDTFLQDGIKRENADSINIPTLYQHNKQKKKGWINVVNPYRATMVLGTPGSGKSFAVYSFFMQQMIQKGYTMYLYDYKYPDLTYEVYNILRLNSDGYKIKPKLYIINFDDVEYSHRCNPISPLFLDEIMDAYEAAYTVMINLNKTWVQKQGDFFVESPIILFAAIIWYLRIYDDGKYCTLPHAIEMLMSNFDIVFKILVSYDELHNYLTPFINAYEQGAQDQLQGQIASAQIPLTRLSSPTIYWVMSGNDFGMDINNPDEPKIICVGNNPDRQNIYGAALSLYNSRIFKIINKKGKLKSAILLDELPTIYIKGLDNLIATARSNKVAIVVGAQDASQMIRDYGDKEADVIINTVGNLFSGMVKGKTAESLSRTFGKAHKKRKSKTFGENNQSVSISYQMEDVLPSNVISTLSQGVFVGQVVDNYDQKIDKKFFHAEIQVDIEAMKKEKKLYRDIPKLADTEGQELKELVADNYLQIKQDIKNIISSEMQRLLSEDD